MKRDKTKPKVLIDSFHLSEALTGIRTYTTQLIQGIEESESLNAEYLTFPDWRKAEASKTFKGRLNLVMKILRHTRYFIHKQNMNGVLPGEHDRMLKR